MWAAVPAAVALKLQGIRYRKQGPDWLAGLVGRQALGLAGWLL